ncbi:hypothetical protein BGZ70_002061 [Mortierella alpina]|uniref:Uncharacterized protein n=1 Tax=Mortierella alpina TaxID=64518 RepID=A0A9P6IY04_MORAP|nr:hypothetical protein BGZ70_002061 [Mortierella alpina]
MSLDFQKATLKKAAVTTLPLWADPEQEQRPQPDLCDLAEEDHDHEAQEPRQPLSATPTHSSESTAGHSSTINGSIGHANGGIPTYASAPLSGRSRKSLSTSSCSQRHSTSRLNGHHQQDWSVFATMSNVSTSSVGPASPRSPSDSTLSSPTEPLTAATGAGAISSLKRFPQKLDEMFRSKPTPAGAQGTTAGSGATANDPNGKEACTCTCPQHRYKQSTFSMRGGRLGLSASKRRNQKESLELMRGYPTGQCVSSPPPEHTNWDEKSSEDLSVANRQSTAKNTAFNLDAFKMFLNSPLFSNILKSLTTMAAVSLFAIALNAIIILTNTPDEHTRLSTNDNAALVVTVILSVLTVAYSCFTIFLESRRPPEGLDTSNSKPLFVIFSEIIASIVWAQILSVTIYIYIWTYGCTEAGQQQLERLWQHNGKLAMADSRLTERLCRRQGAMVGLELLLVVLLIFNFYTHLALNFKFIRAVS